MKTRLSLTVLSALIAFGSIASAAHASERTATRGDQPSANVAPTPDRPGGDPPYDPGRGPGDIKANPSPLGGPDDFDGPAAPPPPFDPKAHVKVIKPGCIGGKMIDYSRHDGKWLPSSGWSLHLWIFQQQAGGAVRYQLKKKLDKNGEWTYCMVKGDEGHEYLFAYESENPRFRLEDTRTEKTNDDPEVDFPYWISPQSLGYNPPTQGGIYKDVPTLPASLNTPGKDVGTLAMDTGPFKLDGDKKNEIYAVGDIVRWGTQLVDKLAANGFKDRRSVEIDGEPAQVAHELHYPNYRANCNGLVGTCYSSFSNKAYLDLDDAHINRFTVQHELGHSLVDEYWGYTSVGGEHGYDQCDTEPELAYSEGVADFIAVWGHNDGFSYDVADDPFNIATPQPIGCPKATAPPGVGVGTYNEEYVAGALWDLHDHTQEYEPNCPAGGDEYGAASSNGVLSMVLNHWVHNVVKLRLDYTSWYPDYQPWIVKAFGCNQIGDIDPDA
jgi:hypothetical protein